MQESKIAVKIRNLILLVLCFARFITKGRANKPVKEPSTVLIAQMAKLGDMVCTTQLFRAVKEKYPRCRVIVMGNTLNQQLLESHKDVDEYIVTGQSVFKTIQEIRKHKIDFAALAAPDFIGLAILYLAGIPAITAPHIQGGVSMYETRPYKMARKFVITKPHQMGRYTPREYLRLLEPIGIQTNNTKKHLEHSAQAKYFALDFYQEHAISPHTDFIVGIAPSVGNRIKLWYGDRFAHVAHYIVRNYSARIVIIGGKADRETADEMIRHVDVQTRVIDSVGQLSIDQLKAVISKMNLFIGVDTGPLYIAEALGIPTVDIIGPLDEKEQPPRGRLRKVVMLENREKPELHIMNARSYNEKEARRQIEEITVEMVIEKINELMKQLSHD